MIVWLWSLEKFEKRENGYLLMFPPTAKMRCSAACMNSPFLKSFFSETGFFQAFNFFSNFFKSLKLWKFYKKIKTFKTHLSWKAFFSKTRMSGIQSFFSQIGYKIVRVLIASMYMYKCFCVHTLLFNLTFDVLMALQTSCLLQIICHLKCTRF